MGRGKGEPGWAFFPKNIVAREVFKLRDEFAKGYFFDDYVSTDIKFRSSAIVSLNFDFKANWLSEHLVDNVLILKGAKKHLSFQRAFGTKSSRIFLESFQDSSS